MQGMREPMYDVEATADHDYLRIDLVDTHKQKCNVDNRHKRCYYW